MNFFAKRFRERGFTPAQAPATPSQPQTTIWWQQTGIQPPAATSPQQDVGALQQGGYHSDPAKAASSRLTDRCPHCGDTLLPVLSDAKIAPRCMACGWSERRPDIATQLPAEPGKAATPAKQVPTGDGFSFANVIARVERI